MAAVIMMMPDRATIPPMMPIVQAMLPPQKPPVMELCEQHRRTEPQQQVEFGGTVEGSS
jgi:hypothetical protein